MQYIGQRGGGTGGSVLAYVDYFAAAPGNGWKALKDVTEFDIFKLRRSGAIPGQPRVFNGNGRSARLPTAAGTSPSSLSSRPFACIGPEAVFTRTGDSTSITAAPLNVAVNYGGATILQAAYPGVSPGITGMSFANDELHTFVSSSGPAYSLLASAPPPANFVIGTGWANGAAFSPASYTAPGAGYNQLTYGAGVYVTWQAGGGQPLRYSAARSSWTACSVAGLNADGSAAGATIANLRFDPIQQKFIGISVYGEIIESTDGITFTKTFTRAAGGTTYGLTQFCTTKDGVLLAAGTGAGAGQYYTAPSNAGPFSLATVSAAGFTFPNRVIECEYSAGVSFFAFNGSISTDANLAYSRDERLTYEVSLAGDSAGGTVGVLAASGVAVLLNTNTGLSATGLVSRLGTDWGNMIAAAVHNDFYTRPAGAGTRLQPYVKVA